MPFESKDIIRESLEEIYNTPPSETRGLYIHYLNPILAQISFFLGMDQRFVEAKGAYLKDDKGRDYLDFLSGFGALNLGHEPDEILEALRFVEGKPNIIQSYLNPFASKLGQYLAAITPGELSRTFLCNSGTEAVEAALKLARKATGRRVLLYTEGAYHGKTFGSLSVSGKQKYRTPFEPLLPETESVPYGHTERLEQRISKGDVAGFIVEPIQGENGVIIPKTGHLKAAETICRKYGTLLLVDEIQTGMGRTGKLFCSDHEQVQPDVLILSKSLGGGVMPIGAMVTTDVIWKKAYGSLETGLLHSSTFGGNARACVCALATIKTLIQKKLPENAEEVGNHLLANLKQLKNRFSILQDVRGKGLMIGLSIARLKGSNKLVEGALTAWIARRLLKKHRIVTAFTMNNLDVLRIAPPLIIKKEETDRFLNALKDVLQSAEKFKWFGLVKQDNANLHKIVRH